MEHKIKTKKIYNSFGGGSYNAVTHQLIGGIYMASNVKDTCQLFPVRVNKPQLAVYDASCNLEHLRHLFGTPVKLRQNRLYWMHDRIPHEAIPYVPQLPTKSRVRYKIKPVIPGPYQRSFFRLCCNDVSVWFASRCTPNRLGIVPPSDVTVVSHYDKWEGLEDPTYAYLKEKMPRAESEVSEIPEDKEWPRRNCPLPLHNMTDESDDY